MIGIVEIVLMVWFIIAIISCTIVGIFVNKYVESNIVIDVLAVIILFFWKYFMILGAVLSAGYILLVV